MALLTRDEILAADDLTIEEVKVPEWGGEVNVRALTGSARDKLESSMVEQKGKDTNVNLADFRARLVSLSIVDENGQPIFNEKDVKALGDKSAAALDRVAAVASRISGMSEDDVKELTEGFDDAPSEGSTSD